MNHRQEIECLEVNEGLSSVGKQKLLEIAGVARLLQVNTEDPFIELALIEKILSESELKKQYNKETQNLGLVQNTLKESLLILTNLEQLSPVSQYCEPENVESLEKEVKDLQAELNSFHNKFYSEDIDHEHLLGLSEDIEKLTKELDKLQQKNELYGDFPVVIFR